MDFHSWDNLLRQYVDDEGRVNYKAWQQESVEDLQRWLGAIAPSEVERSSPDTQLAFWINFYNALTIAEILKSYPIRSILPTFLGIPNWFSFLLFFSRPIFQQSDQSYSLNRIEHKIIRPQFQEPRIHFALVCGAIGCPLLRNGAYFPETVRSQLEADAIRFINNPNKVRYEPEENVLYCSKIFKWYGSDFLKVAPSLPAYIERYWGQTLPADQESADKPTGETRQRGAIAPSATIRFLPYDWGVNAGVKKER